jgi:GNAT superfamily N-acetyltransferase
MMETTPRPDHRSLPEGVAILPFSDAHLEGAFKLSLEMSWSYRIEDWAFALKLGRGMVLTRAGAVIGTAAWFPHGDEHATLGLIIVAGQAQGRGLGALLLDTLIEQGSGRTLILNATPEGRPLYERRGFVPTGTIHQHQGAATGTHDAHAPDSVRSMRPSDLAAVTRLDEQAKGFKRPQLLRRLADTGERLVLTRDGEPVGFVMRRPFGRGTVIGPVVARSADEALQLIGAALSDLKGGFVRVDTPVELGLSPWLEGMGLGHVDDAVAMVRGRKPSTGSASAFALASQSFG